MPDRIACTFFADSHDNIGRRVSVTWDALAARCSDHRAGEKDGPALSCGLFSGSRGNATLTHRTLVALDIEAPRGSDRSPLPIETMADYLRQRAVRCVIWTTHSHTVEAPRYRILVPLPEPLAHMPDVDPYLSAAVAAEFRCVDVCDQSKFGAASLFFLARHRAGAQHFAAVISGNLLSSGRLETMALMMAQNVARDEAEEAARRRSHALPPEIAAKIERFNSIHPVVETLQRYGYTRDGNRFKSPYQHGIAATSLLEGGKWTSFSESDAVAGVGTRPLRASSQCACWGDSFALYVHFEHGGNFRRALESLGD